VSEFAYQEGIQAHTTALSAGWHPLPFMQSLQFAFYRLRSSRDRRAIQQKDPASERLGKRQGTTNEFGRFGRNQRLIFWHEGIDPFLQYIFERSIGVKFGRF